MDSLVKSWQEFLSGERNFSNHTVSAYIIDLNYFLEFFHKNCLCQKNWNKFVSKIQVI